MERHLTQTFIFLDLETSGLPQDYPTKVTEIALVAAARVQILDQHHGTTKENNTVNDFLPRVLNKISLPVYPSKRIQHTASIVSGLTNDNLEHQKPFNDTLFKILELFMERLEKPICLVAHNGNKFDFPILQSELLKLGQALPEDVFCADSLPGFREVLNSNVDPTKSGENDILEGIKPLNNDFLPTNFLPKCGWSNDEYDGELVNLADATDKIISGHTTNKFNHQELQAKLQLEMERIKKINETTPPRKSWQSSSNTSARGTRSTKDTAVRRLVLSEKQPRRMYNLKSLYESLTRKELYDAHRAEVDALALLECVTAVGRPFLDWIDSNKIPFRSIKKMW